MSQLPGGTVTFVFTDIEGSTRLLQELGDEEYGRVSADHRRIVDMADRFEERINAYVERKLASAFESFDKEDERE